MALSNKPTRQSLMQNLLDEAINTLLSKMKQIACVECGARAASAQDISNVLKFLKDNGFTVDPSKGGDALDDLLVEMSGQAATYPALGDELN